MDCGIPLDYADYQFIDSFDGYKIGFKGRVDSMESFIDIVVDKLKKYIPEAKAMAFNIQYAPSNLAYSLTIDIIKEIDKYIVNNNNVRFGAQENQELSGSELELDILMVGLETI